MKLNLIQTNPYLKDPTLRKKMIEESVASSMAIEGIDVSKFNKAKVKYGIKNIKAKSSKKS